jgi:hypothetical protein
VLGVEPRKKGRLRLAKYQVVEKLDNGEYGAIVDAADDLKVAERLAGDRARAGRRMSVIRDTDAGWAVGFVNCKRH